MNSKQPTVENSDLPRNRHQLWVRICHWSGAACFLTLAVTGVLILMVHPRLYWGEVGNDLTPALLEIPISNNHRPEGYKRMVTFSASGDATISANRTYDIFNQNGWARSLHFLVAWGLLITGLIYLGAATVSGHLRQNLLPRLRELAPRLLWQDLKTHMALRLNDVNKGDSYGLLQRCAYVGVVFIALPLMVVTGLTMSPAVAAAFPVLLDLFGGYQSARTVHFFCFVALLLFVVVHVGMVLLTGFRQQLRAMIWGK